MELSSAAMNRTARRFALYLLATGLVVWGVLAILWLAYCTILFYGLVGALAPAVLKGVNYDVVVGIYTGPPLFVVAAWLWRVAPRDEAWTRRVRAAASLTFVASLIGGAMWVLPYLGGKSESLAEILTDFGCWAGLGALLGGVWLFAELRRTAGS